MTAIGNGQNKFCLSNEFNFALNNNLSKRLKILFQTLKKCNDKSIRQKTPTVFYIKFESALLRRFIVFVYAMAVSKDINRLG